MFDVHWKNNYTGSKTHMVGTPTMALVSFNSMYSFGYNLEHVFIQ